RRDRVLGPAVPLHASRRERRAPQRSPREHAGRAVLQRRAGAVRAGARDLRADRGPARHDVGHHRDGVRELGRRHPSRVRRGPPEGAAGNADAMRSHLERALQLVTEHGLLAARAETLAVLAMEAARLGSQTKDAELLAVARKAAADTKTAMEQLPGHAPWGAQADAALARVALAEGNTDEALTAARTAVA